MYLRATPLIAGPGSPIRFRFGARRLRFWVRRDDVAGRVASKRARRGVVGAVADRVTMRFVRE